MEQFPRGAQQRALDMRVRSVKRNVSSNDQWTLKQAKHKFYTVSDLGNILTSCAQFEPCQNGNGFEERECLAMIVYN